MFVGCYENSKSFRIYILGQITIEFIKYVTFDEDETLEKLSISPPSISSKETNDGLDPSTHELDQEDLDEPVQPIDPLDPPPYRKMLYGFMILYRMLKSILLPGALL